LRLVLRNKQPRDVNLPVISAAQIDKRYNPAETEEEPANENERALIFGGGVRRRTSGRIGSGDPGVQRFIPALTPGAPNLLHMPVRDVQRALLFNQAARGEG
jgi:hypothetical protein